MIKSGTAGGILTILLANIRTDDIIKTVILAIIGATVSFGLSLMLQKLIVKKKKRKNKS